MGYRKKRGGASVLKERLQKILSGCGICSRRKAEELILAGRVRVNGKVVRELGTQADLRRDKVEADGQVLHAERRCYFLFNKPKGVITSVSDPGKRRTVMDYFPKVRERIFPIGRLDYHSEGLLLMTNDGELDNLLTHPSREVKKVYEVMVRGKFSQTMADRLSKGVRLPEDGTTAPCLVEVLQYDEENNRTYLRFTLHEGKNREIRKMLALFHFPVFGLKRIKYSFLTLDGVERGAFRRLTREEVERLYTEHGN